MQSLWSYPFLSSPIELVLALLIHFHIMITLTIIVAFVGLSTIFECMHSNPLEFPYDMVAQHCLFKIEQPQFNLLVCDLL